MSERNTAHPSKLQSPAMEAIRKRMVIAAQQLRLTVEEPIDVWAARFVLTADGSVQRGLSLPWYMARHRQIEEDHGGRPEVVALVAGLALAHKGNDPSLSDKDACFLAGNEWRASIRSQYDLRSGEGPPQSIEQMASAMRNHDLEHVGDGEARSLALMKAGMVEYHPADIEEGEPDPRLAEVLPLVQALPERQREALELHIQGVQLTEVGRIMGLQGEHVKQQAYKLIQRGLATIRSQLGIERETAVA